MPTTVAISSTIPENMMRNKKLVYIRIIYVKKERGRGDDVMKTPNLKDLSAPLLCNPPTLQLGIRNPFVARHW